MLAGMLAGLKVELAAAGRRVAFATGGLVFVLIGVLLLALAGWAMLALLVGGIFATLIFAAVFMLVGWMLLTLSRRSYRARDIEVAAEAGAAARGAATASPQGLTLPLLEAFIIGMQAGIAQRR